MTTDRRAPDDDAETPRFAPRAQSQSGETEIDVAAPEHSDDGETPPPVDIFDALLIDPRVKEALVEAMKRTWQHARTVAGRRAAATANHVLDLEATVQRSAPLARPWMRDLIIGVLLLVIGALGAWVRDSYSAAESRTAEMHDQLLVFDQRLGALERTIAVVVVPRIAPSLLQPGGAPGKDPSP